MASVTMERQGETRKVVRLKQPSKRLMKHIAALEAELAYYAASMGLRTKPANF